MTTKTINLLQLAVTALNDLENGWPLTELAALEGKGHLALIQDLKDHIKDLEPAESLKTQQPLSSALRYYQCTVDVSAREGVPEDDIRKVLDRLINTVSGNRAAFLPTSSAGGDRIEADWPRSVASTALG